jgi:hypothetical protein
LVVPYRWSGKGDAQSAAEVVLYVSRDRGAHWQKVASAAPHVRSFHYQAPADGEYAFAIRTYDRTGGFQPPGPVQPEMRVMVDTVPPKITRFEATDDGLDVRVSVAGSDGVAIEPASVRLYAQADGRGGWSPVSMELVGGRGEVAFEARAMWRPPVGRSRVLLRATLVDRAGNRAESSCIAQSASPSDPRLQANPFVAGGAAPGNPPTPWAPPVANATPSPSPPTVGSPLLGSPWGAPTASKPPTASFASAKDPFAATDSGLPSGAPPMVGAPPETADALGDAVPSEPVAAAVGGGWRSDVLAQADGPIDPQAWPADATRRVPLVSADAPSTAVRPPAASAPPSPFSTASFGDRAHEGNRADNSVGRLQIDPRRPASVANPWGDRDSLWGDAPASTPTTRPGSTATPGEPLADFGRPLLARSVNSTEFELDYELTQTGRWGVASVELWGTDDGGATWRRFAIDSDRQSPIHVTVPGEGDYGFRVLVESVGGLEADRPRGGDKPEVQVRVDLAAPRVTLARVEQGQGYFADQLRIDWRVEEEHPTRAPIDLYYSNRPTGPWLPVATALDDSGSHTWRLQRHLPQRLYLRLEARDEAGNVGSATTPEPITLELPQAAANLSGVRPVGP